MTCVDDFGMDTRNALPAWQPFEGTFRELRMDAVRRMQSSAVTYTTDNMAWRNPNGGASRSWWNSVPVNRIANPGFETNTTGWNITANGPELTSAAVSITRTAGGHDGSGARRSSPMRPRIRRAGRGRTCRAIRSRRT